MIILLNGERLRPVHSAQLCLGRRETISTAFFSPSNKDDDFCRDMVLNRPLPSVLLSEYFRNIYGHWLLSFAVD